MAETNVTVISNQYKDSNQYKLTEMILQKYGKDVLVYDHLLKRWYQVGKEQDLLAVIEEGVEEQEEGEQTKERDLQY